MNRTIGFANSVSAGSLQTNSTPARSALGFRALQATSATVPKGLTFDVRQPNDQITFSRNAVKGFRFEARSLSEVKDGTVLLAVNRRTVEVISFEEKMFMKSLLRSTPYIAWLALLLSVSVYAPPYASAKPPNELPSINVDGNHPRVHVPGRGGDPIVTFCALVILGILYAVAANVDRMKNLVTKEQGRTDSNGVASKRYVNKATVDAIPNPARRSGLLGLGTKGKDGVLLM